MGNKKTKETYPAKTWYDNLILNHWGLTLSVIIGFFVVLGIAVIVADIVLP